MSVGWDLNPRCDFSPSVSDWSLKTARVPTEYKTKNPQIFLSEGSYYLVNKHSHIYETNLLNSGEPSEGLILHNVIFTTLSVRFIIFVIFVLIVVYIL